MTAIKVELYIIPYCTMKTLRSQLRIIIFYNNVTRLLFKLWESEREQHLTVKRKADWIIAKWLFFAVLSFKQF